MAMHNVLVPHEGAFATAGTETPVRFSCPPNHRNYMNKLSELEIGGGNDWMNAWIDSMKASSPTSTLRTTLDDEHDQPWLKEHPSALAKFDEITMSLRGKQLVMFLDYDGTLSPIVDDPDRAFISEDMKRAVKQLAKLFPTAIVSGRSRNKVQSFVNLRGLYYAGSHGLDIKMPIKRGPKHTKSHAKPANFQPASEYLAMINEVYEELVERTRSILGAKVENNKFCLSVHYRCVDEVKWSSVAENVKAVVDKYQKLHLTQGRKVWEIRPTIKWHKGKALEYLLESLGFVDHNKVLPIYIGDDRTDEDAFKVLRDKGMGFGILVSKHPKETQAFYSLREPNEVMHFLRRLVECKDSKKGEEIRV